MCRMLDIEYRKTGGVVNKMMEYLLTWIGFLMLITAPYLTMFIYLIWARKEIAKRWDEWFEILNER